MSIAPAEWDAFFDGSADTEIVTRIDRAIVSDAAVRRAYLEQARFHWQVGGALRHFQGTVDGGGTDGGAAGSGGAWVWGGGTAFLLTLALTAWLLWPAAPAAPESWRLVAGELHQPAGAVLTVDTPLPAGAELRTAIAQQATIASDSCQLYCGPVSDLQVTGDGQPMPRHGRFLIQPTAAEHDWQLHLPTGRLQGRGPGELLIAADGVQVRGADLQVSGAAAVAVLPPLSGTPSAFGCALLPAVAARYRRGDGLLALDPSLAADRQLVSWTPADLLARHDRYALGGIKPQLADGRLLLPVADREQVTVDLPLMDAGDAWSLQTDFSLVAPESVAEYTINCGPSFEPIDPSGVLQSSEERFVSSRRWSQGRGPIPFAIRFVRVGSYRGYALFEVACFADGVCYNRGWVIGYPSAVRISYRGCGMSFGRMRIATLDLPLDRP